MFAQSSSQPSPSQASESQTSDSQTSSSSTDAFLVAATQPGAPCNDLQTTPCTTTAKPAQHRTETSISLGVFPQLTATRTEDQFGLTSSQGMSPSAGVLATMRQSFRPWFGYAINMGYTRTNEHFIDQNYPANDPRDNFAVTTEDFELSGAYFAQTHLNTRLTGFTDLGAGVLSFLPTHRSSDAILYAPAQDRSFLPSVNFRPVGIGGVGVDYHVSNAFALRVEYRGQLYKNPDFRIQVLKRYTVTSEPTVSLSYTFGHKHTSANSGDHH